MPPEAVTAEIAERPQEGSFRTALGYYKIATSGTYHAPDSPKWPASVPRAYVPLRDSVPTSLLALAIPAPHDAGSGTA